MMYLLKIIFSLLFCFPFFKTFSIDFQRKIFEQREEVFKEEISDAVLIRLKHKNGEIIDFNSLSKNSNIPLEDLIFGTKHLKSKGLILDSDTFKLTQKGWSRLDSIVSQGGLILVDSKSTEGSALEIQNTSKKAIVLNGIEVTNNSSLKVSADKPVEIIESVISDSSEVLINTFDSLQSNVSLNPKSNTELVSKENEYVNGEGSLLNFIKDALSNAIGGIIAFLVTSTIIYFAKGKDILDFFRKRRVIKMNKKAYQNYIINNTKLAGKEEYHLWLAGYKSRAGQVSKNSRHLRDFTRFRTISKKIYLKYLARSAAFTFLVMESGSIEYLDESEGHNKLYFMDGFTTNDSSL